MYCAKARFGLLAFAILSGAPLSMAQEGDGRIAGTVVDPAGKPISGARVETLSRSGLTEAVTSDDDGGLLIGPLKRGSYTVRVKAAGFADRAYQEEANSQSPNVTLRLEKLAGAIEEVVVSADVSDAAIAAPDPSEKVMVREELLDANPGRPGAPISIPGLPIETAAGGIKAPQYFAPGVAGDHGEPIAQYIAVGGYLVSNNLSANAHGNGYADPNIFVSGALSSVTTDGGAFNALEGNHALNLAATYGLSPKLRSFETLTTDNRDVDLSSGLAPSDSTKSAWLALELNLGNGLLRRPEHRRQFKWNAQRTFNPGTHEITLFSLGYYGNSFEGNLVPVGLGEQLNDTIDPRQRDQTHTGMLAADDQWKVGPSDVAAFSGFFRTYNLALFSNFGEGLIRQSEFRTVEGAEARETHTFKPWLESMAGLIYNEDDIHNDDLDHYLSANSATYGSFIPVLGNNVTIREVVPYGALHGDLGKHLRFYGGLRDEQVEIKNADKFRSAYSFDEWKGFLEPKATITWSPGVGPARWLPTASFSVGQAFFTQDPRIELAPSATGTGDPTPASPFERSHAEQLVFEKELSATDLRLTLGKTTMTATSGKIDPDNGTEFDLGPSTLKFLTASARHQFSLGTIQAVFSKADARLQAFGSGSNYSPAMVVPEAPRTIFDALSTLDRMPLGLHARGEYEYVGHKLLDAGNPLHPSQYEAIPVGETRLALVRSFLNGRLELTGSSELARGYTGQTTENFAPTWTLGQVPYCAPGSGPSSLPNDFDCANPSLGGVEVGVGVRMVSWVGGSISWRFNSGK